MAAMYAYRRSSKDVHTDQKLYHYFVTPPRRRLERPPQIRTERHSSNCNSPGGVIEHLLNRSVLLSLLSFQPNPPTITPSTASNTLSLGALAQLTPERGNLWMGEGYTTISTLPKGTAACGAVMGSQEEVGDVVEEVAELSFDR